MPAILFDIDDTLLDSADLHAWQEALGPADLLSRLAESPFAVPR